MYEPHAGEDLSMSAAKQSDSEQAARVRCRRVTRSTCSSISLTPSLTSSDDTLSSSSSLDHCCELTITTDVMCWAVQWRQVINQSVAKPRMSISRHTISADATSSWLHLYSTQPVSYSLALNGCRVNIQTLVLEAKVLLLWSSEKTPLLLNNQLSELSC